MDRLRPGLGLGVCGRNKAAWTTADHGGVVEELVRRPRDDQPSRGSSTHCCWVIPSQPWDLGLGSRTAPMTSSAPVYEDTPMPTLLLAKHPKNLAMDYKAVDYGMDNSM
jgi:hypothetical protein